MRPAVELMVKGSEIGSSLADELEKAGGIRDARLPAEVALNEVVGFLNAGSGNDVAGGVAVASHKPQVISHGCRSGYIVGHNDNGV